MNKIFGSPSPAPAPAPAPAAAPSPAGIPPNYQAASPASATTDANGMFPPNADGQPPADGTAISPLDEFTNLWQNDAKSDDAPPTGLLGDLDPKQFVDASKKVNFARAVSQEDLAAIQAGGEGAVRALGSALNTVTQAVYAQSALASSKLIEQATSKLEERILANLPDQVRRNLLDNSMVEDNAAYSHPAAAPLVQLVQNQLATKHPNATPSQLKKMAQQYFNNSLSAITGDKSKNEPTSNKPNTETDWGEELDLF